MIDKGVNLKNEPFGISRKKSFLYAQKKKEKYFFIKTYSSYSKQKKHFYIS